MNYTLDLAKYFILSCFRLKLRCVYPDIRSRRQVVEHSDLDEDKEEYITCPECKSKFLLIGNSWYEYNPEVYLIN
jgi:DNA-directed RNA polymerase subunit RPC12/RpoP